MSRADQRVAAAEARVVRARAALIAQIDEVADRLSPAYLVQQVAREARGRGWQLAVQAVLSPQARPVLATIAASGLGWLLSRRPGLLAIAKLFLGSGATGRRSGHSSRSTSRPRAARRAPKA